jgi:hypothetical protein
MAAWEAWISEERSMLKRIVDLVRGKPNSQPAPKLQPANQDEPRPQHYFFAHRILPSMFFEEPDQLMKIMGSAKGLDFLRFQWNNLSTHVEHVEPPTALDYQTRKLDDDTTIVLVTMPPPHKITEAYFVAFVYRPSTAENGALTRYFTLEYGVCLLPDEPTRMVLGEWTARQEHLNYGHHFAPDPATFFKTISEKLQHPVGHEFHGGFSPG